MSTPGSSELRRDPLSGRLVMIAPARESRPGAGHGGRDVCTPGELEACPFCAGREDRTPPETLRLGNGPTGWGVRVIPNLYPAAERQEVVVHTPRHARSVVDLTAGELALVAKAWSERLNEPRANGSYVHALVNEGREAGSSLPHSHSQLVWLAAPPPVIIEEGPRLRAGSCALCKLLAEERVEGLHTIAQRAGLSLLAAWAGRLPYELLIAGEHPDQDGGWDAFLDSALGLVAEGLRRIHHVEGAVAANAWLHLEGHPHMEIVPRLTVLAGLELGAGVYVNTLAPEVAAARLRDAGRER